MFLEKTPNYFIAGRLVMLASSKERAFMFRFRVYVYLIDDTPFTDRCVPPYSLCSFRRKSYHLKSCRITTYKLTQLRNATMSWYLRTTSNININHVNYLKVTAKGIGCWCYLHTTTKVLGISYAQSGYFMDSSPFSPIYLSCAVVERLGQSEQKNA